MKKKYLTTGIFIGVFFLCAAIVGAAVRFFPLLRAAQTVRRVLSAECMEYDIHVTLNQEQFSGKQEQFLQAVSWILETDESACLSWEVGGKISDGQGYAQIFCEGLDGPVTDVYFDKNDIWPCKIILPARIRCWDTCFQIGTTVIICLWSRWKKFFRQILRECICRICPKGHPGKVPGNTL